MYNSLHCPRVKEYYNVNSVVQGLHDFKILSESSRSNRCITSVIKYTPLVRPCSNTTDGSRCFAQHHTKPEVVLLLLTHGLRLDYIYF